MDAVLLERAVGATMTGVLNRHTQELSAAAMEAHDRQKDFPDPFWDDLTTQLRDRLPIDTPVLDAGVGSGLIAKRLAAVGVGVLGVDFNPSMLKALRERIPAAPVAVGDVTVLPVRNVAVDAVMMTNVLHLLPNWRSAVGEAVRVLRHGGVFIVGLGVSEAGGPWSEVGRHFRSVAAVDEAALRTGPQSIDDLLDCMSRQGLKLDVPIEVSGDVERTIRDVIYRLQHNVFTWPADTPQPLLDAAAESTLAWAADQRLAVDARYSVSLTLRLQVARRG